MRKTLEQLQASLERLLEKREQLISMLVTNDEDVRWVRSAIKRRLRQIEKDRFATPVVNVTAVAMRDDPPPPTSVVFPDPGDALAIPDFLKRDRAAKAEIEQSNAERKRTKAQVRIEKLKAKQSGETRRVPLTGKDALRFIREGKR